MFDVTGHNLGAAFSEALGFACDEDWDLAWDLVPGEDYEDALVEGYDEVEHLVQPTGRTKEGKRVRGVLTFLRLAGDIRNLKGSGVKKRLQAMQVESRQAGPVDDSSPGPVGRIRFSKRQVADAVRKMDLLQLTRMAMDDVLVLHKIQRLLYSADENLRWMAVLALGGVVGAIADKRPARCGDLLRRLIYAGNDSAAANWGMIEAAGEIIRNRPETYGYYINNILSLLADPPSRPAVLWAVGRIGEVSPKTVRNSAFFTLLRMLDDTDSSVRGHACWALGQMKAVEVKNSLARHVDDSEPVRLFDGESIIDTTVGELASWAIKRISGDSMDTNELKKDDQGIAGQDSDNPEAAEFRRAQALYKEAEVLISRGMSLDAMQKLEEALEIFESVGSHREIANACDKKGDVHWMRGDLKRALPLYQRALAICEKNDDAISTVILSDKIIDLYRQQKDYDKALPYYYRSLELVEELGDSGRAAFYLTGIGDIYQNQGKIEDALDAYRIALRIYRGMKSRERAEILEKGVARLEALLYSQEA